MKLKNKLDVEQGRKKMKNEKWNNETACSHVRDSDKEKGKRRIWKSGVKILLNGEY